MPSLPERPPLLDRASGNTLAFFERALRAKNDWKVASAAQEALRPIVDVLIAKKEQLAELQKSTVGIRL